MKRFLILLVIFGAISCTSSTSRLSGSMSEPVEIEVAVPFIDTDSVPLLYGFVSDSSENAIFPLNLSLRKFVESEVPYFPMRIPVGRYPTKISVDRSQKRLFVLNYLDKTISVVDTVNLTESGFLMYNNGAVIYEKDGNVLRKDIGLFASDIKTVYDTVLKKEFLIVTGLDNDFRGRIKIIDIDEKGTDGTINRDGGRILFDIEIGFLPSSIAVSDNGDEVFIGSKNESKFAVLSLSAQGIIYISSPLVPDILRYSHSRVYLINSESSRMSVFDTDKKEFLSVLPESIFGKITVQPLQTDYVRDLAFSPESNLGGVIDSSSYSGGCKGTVAFIINTQGNVFAIDTDGCSLCDDAEQYNTKVPCNLKGWYNLPVENEITEPTVSRPLMQIGEKILSNNEQGLAEYPFIENWDNSERNFGIGISRLFRSNMYGREIQITYEGGIVEGTGSISNGKFFPDIQGFENFDIRDTDILDLRDINGNPVKNCDDGRYVENNEFRILSVSLDGISVDGKLPSDDCLGKYYFFTRPYKGWTVHINGYGFLGRAYENESFSLKDEKGVSHLKFTLKSGKNDSLRGMKFFSKIFINPYGFSPGEKLITPASMKVVQDCVDKKRYYGLIVYTGSKAIWQFSSKDLDPNSSIVYLSLIHISEPTRP
ncbi:MAG: hypothetical protein N3B13_06920, partial [Deltaproteobacteria bacterium]|nr:hypothetical protein [Deltaproteobacteria bacterium]